MRIPEKLDPLLAKAKAQFYEDKSSVAQLARLQPLKWALITSPPQQQGWGSPSPLEGRGRDGPPHYPSPDPPSPPTHPPTPTRRVCVCVCAHV
jgi:hypothetical protein